MININDLFGRPEYAWAVPVAFSLIILFNIFTGIFKGWKSSLYYLGWNIIAVVVGVFATKPILKLALDNINTSSSPVDLQGFLGDHKALVPVVLIAWLLVIMPIAALIKIPFRKKLSLGKPASGRARLGGAAISAVGSIPMAVFAANATTMASGSTGMSPFIDSMVKGLTMGQYEGISKYVDEIKNVVDLAQNGGLKAFEDIFSGTTPDVNDPQKHNEIQSALNGPSVSSILENAQGTFLDKLTTNKPTLQQIQGAQLPDDKKFVVSKENWDNISNVLSSKYNWDTALIDAIKTSFIK